MKYILFENLLTHYFCGMDQFVLIFEYNDTTFCHRDS